MAGLANPKQALIEKQLLIQDFLGEINLFQDLGEKKRDVSSDEIKKFHQILTAEHVDPPLSSAKQDTSPKVEAVLPWQPKQESTYRPPAYAVCTPVNATEFREDAVCDMVKQVYLEKRVYLEKGQEGTALPPRVGMEFKDDVLPGTQLFMFEKEDHRLAIVFVSKNAQSRERLCEGAPELAPKIARTLPRDILFKVTTRSVEDSVEHDGAFELQADAPVPVFSMEHLNALSQEGSTQTVRTEVFKDTL